MSAGGGAGTSNTGIRQQGSRPSASRSFCLPQALMFPTKIDTPASAVLATADPATTTSRDDTGSSATAVAVPVPVGTPASSDPHHKSLSEEETAVLPLLKETSDLQQAAPGSTDMVGGVAPLPAEGTAAERPTTAAAAEAGVAGGAVLPHGSAAAREKETAPVREESTSTAGMGGSDAREASPAVGATEGPIQQDVPASHKTEGPTPSSVAASPDVSSPEASMLKAPETETAAAPGSALAAPLSSKPSPKKAVSFKEDSLPPAGATAAESPAVAEKEAKPRAASTAEFPPDTAAPHAAEEAPGSILLTPIQETNLTRSGASLGDTAPADSGYLSSAEISEMPGIGRSVPATPEAEAGSVLVGGAEQPKTLTKPEEQIIDSQEQGLPASKIHEEHAKDRDLSPSSKDTTAVAGASQGPAVVEPVTASTSAGVSSAKSPIADEGAAEAATGSALTAGASAGAANAAAAAPVGKQLSAKHSRKLEKQASKREASARAQALKEKEKADQARFKEKRKEERAHKKEQAKRMQQERQQAGTGGGKTNVGIFGFLSKPKKEEKKEEGEKSVTPESQAVGDPAIAAGPSFAGRGAAGAGLSGPANALGATGSSRSNMGASADPSGVETGSNVSGYLASQGIGSEGGSSKAPEGTPEMISLEDAPATSEAPGTEVAPREPTTKGPATPGQIEEPIRRPEPEGEIAPLPVSTPEPVASSSRSVEEPASPQDVAVVFAHPSAAGESTPIKEVEAVDKDAEAPVTPPQNKGGEGAAAAGVSAAVMPKKKKEKKPKVKKEKKPKVKKEKEPKVKKEKKPKVKKVKTDRNIDYSAIQMLNVPESKLRDGFNPATGQYDTTQGKRVAPGAFSPLRTNQPVVQQSARLAKQDTLERRKSRKMGANEVTPLLPSRSMAPAGRGIERAEASSDKADYRPLSRSFA